MITRRVFVLVLAAGAATLWPPAAESGTADKVRRVGVLMSTTPVAASHIVVAFADGLRELGYVEGKNVVFEYRWAQGKSELLPKMAADLVQQNGRSSPPGAGPRGQTCDDDHPDRHRQ